VNRGEFDWASLSQAVETAVRFLDNVIDANFYPIQACRKMTLKTRKIGLGVMGFADLLLKLGLPYDSAGGRDWGERVMSFVDRRAKEVSMRLAQERGSFPSFRRSLWARLGYPAMRNATVSTVAPTGTLSLLAGCSSGIEPVFAARFERHILDGRVFEEVHPALQEVLDECGYAGGLSEDKLKEILKGAWSPARDVSVEGHVRMQAVFQRHSDSAVSKTINLPQRATPEDVRRAYLMAYDLGCKGITVYRDQSRPSQVLQAESENCSVCAD
jgi:ribonucleoside-diphosphate reductase alpha chain